MKNLVLTAILGIIACTSYSQTDQFYKIGDTLYYQNNRATFLKTNTLVIIKETNVDKNINNFKVEKYLLDTNSNKYILDAKFITNGLQQLKANGIFTSYHANGEIASVGETVNGRKGDGLWTYYYKNGKKKSEEKHAEETFFNDRKDNLIVNFWDETGKQTVENGNGFAEFTTLKDGLLHKGSYKEGFKNGLWTAFKGKQKIYEETYKNGKLLKGKSWNTNGQIFNYKKINSPAFYKKKNSTSVTRYVARKFNANTAGVIGSMNVNFVVTKDGNVSNVTVVRGLTQDYNNEVTKILSEMKGWTAAKKRGQSHNSTYSLTLNFKG